MSYTLPIDTKRFKRADGLKWGQLKVGTKLVKLDAEGRWRDWGELVEHRTTREGVGGQLVRLVVWQTKKDGTVEAQGDASIWFYDALAFVRPSGTCPRCKGDGFVAPVKQPIMRCKMCAGFG